VDSTPGRDFSLFLGRLRMGMLLTRFSTQPDGDIGDARSRIIMGGGGRLKGKSGLSHFRVGEKCWAPPGLKKNNLKRNRGHLDRGRGVNISTKRRLSHEHGGKCGRESPA